MGGTVRWHRAAPARQLAGAAVQRNAPPLFTVSPQASRQAAAGLPPL
jgi:hypothetical protein